jgi:hypothetical protein
MKKMLIVLMVLAFMFVPAMAQLMPDWVEDMNPGDFAFQGGYSANMAVVEDYFTPQEMNTGFTANNDQGVGITINQEVESDFNSGYQNGIDRQFFTASANAGIAISPYTEADYDPENPTGPAPIAFVFIDTAQSGAISGEWTYEDVTIPSQSGTNLDPYGGDHEVIVEVGPELEFEFSNYATVFTPEMYVSTSVHDAEVEISIEDSDPWLYISDPYCNGYGETWGTTMSPSHLQEVGGAATSSVQAVEFSNGAVVLNGAASMSGAIENADLVPSGYDDIVSVNIDFNTEHGWQDPFQFWYGFYF